MPSGKIVIDPNLLMSQSAEMFSLTENYDSLFQAVSSSLTTMNARWSANLSNNFAAKITSASSAFAMLKELLSGGANSAKLSAETFQSLDSTLGLSLAGSSMIQALGDVKTNDLATMTWNQVKEAWNETGNIFELTEEQYNALPDWAKESVERAFPEGIAVVQIANDVLNGDLSIDTLESFLKGIGASSPEVTAVTSIVEHVLDEDGFVQEMDHYYNGFIERAAQCAVNGDIKGAAENLGMSLVAGGAAMMDTLAEGTTEVVGSLFDRIGHTASAVMKLAGGVIPGEAGAGISWFSDIYNDATDTVVNWFRNLF